MKIIDALEKLKTMDREHRSLVNAIALLQWDQETYMPNDAADDRSSQLALLEGIAHTKFTARETGEYLALAGSTTENPRGDESFDIIDRDFLRVVRRAYDRAVKLPPDFVQAKAKAEALSQAAWVQAKNAGSFEMFLPHLNTMIDFSRKTASYFQAAGKSLYDTLLDTYEPNMGGQEISALFSPLQESLTSLLAEIKRRGEPDLSFMDKEFPIEKQAAFSQKIMDFIGFNKNRGRTDVSAHPFCTSLGAHDVRITTRYFPRNLLSGIFSTIHECGHALYELGFAPQLRGTSLADGASCGIHEAQSRLWENVIGRSRTFWKNLYPSLQEFFPQQLGGVSLDQFYLAVNEVKPSLIRVDADEVSYSLHIILRFEIEKQLIAGDLKPEDLPKIWNEKTKLYLGIDNQALGMTNEECVLQDIHWAMGAFGYFPSYAIGNLYGLHFYKKLLRDIPDFENLVSDGNFAKVHTWFSDNVYSHGCRLEPLELLQKVTGEKLSTEPFLQYLGNKFDFKFA